MKSLKTIILLFLVSTALTSCNDTDIAELQTTNTINYNKNGARNNEFYIIEKDEIGDWHDDDRRRGEHL